MKHNQPEFKQHIAERMLHKLRKEYPEATIKAIKNQD